ncbi:hypothetical protein QBC32DRAFT_234498 [Pseudoneurospora amorphoporcata]|uniref:Centromere protein Scm3 n=1 Tax=Pseudoneurospora amorphoporcata TaxID=241081 RepID=A0AAN6NX27_9PEZI|nr:hypothetical protein QBC32DRAFT_234498 [Pseudoneurospora amorphoporcata]
MERPTKRPRTGPAPFDDEEVVGDELNHQPEEVNQLRDPGYQLEKARSYAAFKLKSAFENIFEKYGKDFDGIGDEIDLRTGEIVVDNGHIKSLRTDTIGLENDDDDESGSESGNEEETITPGQEIKQNATALQTASRPLPSMAPPSPFGAFSPGYNSFPGGPPQMSNMMYPGQAQFQSFPMPSGAFSSANVSIDPAWRAPDLPPSVPWGGFWTPGTQTRVKTVAKVQQLIAGTHHAQEGENEDDLLLDVSTTEITKATENAPVITKKLAPFRPPSIVSSPANHQLKKAAAISTPKAVGKPDAVNKNGEKKKTPKRKTPARTNPVEERITSRVEETDIHAAASPVVDGPSADTQSVIEPEPAVEQVPVAEKPVIEGQASVGSNTEEVKRKRMPNRKTPTSDKSSSARNADITRDNHLTSTHVTAAESETRPVVVYEPSIEDRSDQPSVDESRVEAPLVKDPAVATDQRTSKRNTPTRRVSTRAQDRQGPSTNPSANDSNQSALAPPVELPLVGAQLVVEIQSSLTAQSFSEQPSVQETIVEGPVVEENSIDEGPVAETEPPSAGGDEDQSASVSTAVTKLVNHDLPEVSNVADSRTARVRRRLSVRDQLFPVRAKQPLEELLASRYKNSLFNGESNANTTIPLQYYSPSHGALITKPSNQHLWVEIPVDGTLDPKAFQVMVDDDALISEVPAPEPGRETASILGTEDAVRSDIAKPQVTDGPETRVEAAEEGSPQSSDPPHEVFTRNVVDAAYAFSDEDEPAIPKTKIRRVELSEPDPKPKAAEKPSVKEFGIPTPSSSFDHGDQTTESEATSQTEIPVEELPVISAIMTTETARQTPTTGLLLLDKTNTNSEELPSLPEPVQVTKPKRGRPGRKPKTPLDLGNTISPGVTSTPAVAENPSEPVPFATALALTLPRRQSLRLSRGRRDSDVTIAESTTPQHATATVFQHEDESRVIRESPQCTPEPELEPEDETGGPASPTLSATFPASPELIETSAPDEELPADSLLEEAVARQRFWSPKPESIILGHEPSSPEPRAITVLEVQIPSRRMSQAETVMDVVTPSEPIPPTSPSPPPREQEQNIEDIQPQQQPEQPTTPVKAKPRRGRPPSATSLPTATVTTVTKVKTKSGPGPGSGSGLLSSRKTARTPSTTTTTRTTAAVPIASAKRILTLKQQSQSRPQAQTPGTSRSTKSILSLISSDTDDEDELTLDFVTGTPSGTVNSIRKRGRPRKSITTSSGVPNSQSRAKKTSTSLLLSSSLLRTPSRKKITSLAKIASSSISVGRSTPVSRSGAVPGAGSSRAVTPSAGSEAEDFVGSEVIQMPGGTLRRCGEAGFRCDRNFCFGCL